MPNIDLKEDKWFDEKIKFKNNVSFEQSLRLAIHNILNEECQDDISKYVYCNETNTPAYSGSYNDTPATWVEKYYIVKQALEIREQKLTEKMKNANVKWSNNEN